jgi:hypothetical protein
MDTVVEFFTTVAVVMTTTALSHFGVAADGLEARSHKSQSERVIKRSAPAQPQTTRSRPPAYTGS